MVALVLDVGWLPDMTSDSHAKLTLYLEELEPVFIKHYAPDICLPLTLNIENVCIYAHIY